MWYITVRTIEYVMWYVTMESRGHLIWFITMETRGRRMWLNTMKTSGHLLRYITTEIRGNLVWYITIGKLKINLIFCSIRVLQVKVTHFGIPVPRLAAILNPAIRSKVTQCVIPNRKNAVNINSTTKD